MQFYKQVTALLLFIHVILPVFAQEGKEVPTDPQYHTGQLPNGFTFYIRENHFPEGDCHIVLIQKPSTQAVYHRVWETPAGASEGIDALVSYLKEQRITTPGQYRPHLQGIIVVGSFSADSVEVWLKTRLALLPASVDVLQAQEPTSSIEEAMEAKMLTAKPLSPVWPQGYPIVSISYSLPPLTREQMVGSGYYAMDFMRFALLQTARNRLPSFTKERSNDQMKWISVAPEEQQKARFYQLAQSSVSLAERGITQVEFEEAKKRYLQQIQWDYQSAGYKSHTFYIEACTHHFLDGTPLPSAQWQYSFVSQLLPFITLEHQNRYIRGVMNYSGPDLAVEYPVSSADSLIFPRTLDAQSLQEERRDLTAKVDDLMFPFDDVQLSEITARLMDIDIQLQLDSLDKVRVVPVITVDTLRRLYEKALAETLYEDEPVPLPSVSKLDRGTIERGFRTKMEGVTLWQLSGGSVVYLWPDSLTCEQVYFAAVEHNPSSVGSLLPQEIFRPLGNGPLEWKQTAAGYLLQGSAPTSSLRSFIEQAAGQISLLTTVPQVTGELQKQRAEQIAAAGELSMAILLDSLCNMAFASSDSQTMSYPRSFDYVFTGDICVDSLQVYIEDYLASLPSDGIMFSPANMPADGMRRGNYQKSISFPNPAQENKYAQVFTGVCPYTQEQYVLLQLLQQLVTDASGGAVCAYAVLDPNPIGHYLFYIGYSVQETDAAYNRHQIEQILVDLTAYGPSQTQLQQARNTLRVRYKEQQTQAVFHREVLLQYARTQRDFQTNYLDVLQRQDVATVRDFVRQIMEYGNSFQVELNGATKTISDASYTKIP